MLKWSRCPHTCYRIRIVIPGFFNHIEKSWTNGLQPIRKAAEIKKEEY